MSDIDSPTEDKTHLSQLEETVKDDISTSDPPSSSKPLLEEISIENFPIQRKAEIVKISDVTDQKSTKKGLTLNLIAMSFIILFGNILLYGYNIGVLNQPASLIQEFYNRTYTERLGYVDDYTITFLWSATTALYMTGGMIGAFITGSLADRFGRKKTVLISCIPVIIGAIISTTCVVASAPELLMIGRFIVGFSCGITTMITPMYVMEICPDSMKGAFGSASQMFCTIGISLASVIGIKEILGTKDLWPYLLLINVVPSVLCLLTMPFFPESPRYLMITKNDKTAAIKALQFLRQVDDVESELDAMQTEATVKYSMMQVIRAIDLRQPLIIACSLQIMQQLSGINAIFFYSSSIYSNAGVPSSAIPFAVIGTCAMNTVMSIVAVRVVDKAGRRPLLLFPMFIMILINGVIVAALKFQSEVQWLSYVSIACVISYVICFATGLGPIPSVLGAEMFEQGPRAQAMSMSLVCQWIAALMIAIGFELIQKVMKEYTFLIFFILMIFFTIFVFRYVPETKNQTFEQIAESFRRKRKRNSESSETKEEAKIPLNFTDIKDEKINGNCLV